MQRRLGKRLSNSAAIGTASATTTIDRAKICCATVMREGRSRCDEAHCDPFRIDWCVPLCECAFGFAAIARARSSGCKSDQPRMRDYSGRGGQLSSCHDRSADRFSCSGDSIFRPRCARSCLGSITVSRREHFRARAARVRLARKTDRVFARSVSSLFIFA
jgi:hypothetical protein